MTVEMNALLATYDLDGANQARLQKASKMVMALLPEVLDHFYDRVGREPEMAAFFKSDKMLERAKGEQLKHWSRLFSGEYCEDYQSSARNIGQVHTRIGKRQGAGGCVDQGDTEGQSQLLPLEPAGQNGTLGDDEGLGPGTEDKPAGEKDGNGGPQPDDDLAGEDEK